MDAAELRQIADSIDTYARMGDATRALVVFNLGESCTNATAVFPSELTWREDFAFPGVWVSTWDNEPVPVEIAQFELRSDPKGRPDCVRLRFELKFQVSKISQRSWNTFIAGILEDPRASSCQGARSVSQAGLAEPLGRLVTLETTRHPGHLSPAGTF